MFLDEGVECIYTVKFSLALFQNQFVNKQIELILVRQKVIFYEKMTSDS